MRRWFLEHPDRNRQHGCPHSPNLAPTPCLLPCPHAGLMLFQDCPCALCLMVGMTYLTPFPWTGALLAQPLPCAPLPLPDLNMPYPQHLTGWTLYACNTWGHAHNNFLPPSPLSPLCFFLPLPFNLPLPFLPCLALYPTETYLVPLVLDNFPWGLPCPYYGTYTCLCAYWEFDWLPCTLVRLGLRFLACTYPVWGPFILPLLPCLPRLYLPFPPFPLPLLPLTLPDLSLPNMPTMPYGSRLVLGSVLPIVYLPCALGTFPSAPLYANRQEQV